MSDKESNSFKIRPYARLLAMLGDQLIKNEIVALTELIKNAYDADADNCYVDFVNVKDDYGITDSSQIVISDDGYGMSKKILTSDFLNPATPVKKLDESIKKSKKGRICQGEKGVGRFSMLKLGRKVTVYTKQINSETIHKVILDFIELDDELIGKKAKNTSGSEKKPAGLRKNEIRESSNREHDKEAKILFLDELDVDYEEASPSELPEGCTILSEHQGTVIIIENLKGEWDEERIQDLKNELVKFSPLEIDNERVITNRDFNIEIRKNHNVDPYYDESIERLKNIIEDKALYKITGSYNEKAGTIKFTYSEAKSKNKSVIVRLKKTDSLPNDFEQKLWNLSYYRNEIQSIFTNDNKTQCGPFNFEFYIFDFAATAADDYGLTKPEKDTVKDHRIFLYRDGVRVQPYGAPNDDWLQIDRKRATARANEMFSNDQIIGQIKITKDDNKNLKDKTSREGIIEDGKAFEQLTAIIRVILSLIRTGLYANYAAMRKKRNDFEKEKQSAEQLESFKKLDNLLRDNVEGKKYLSDIQESFKTQQAAFDQRMRVVESLAGVGLSVEAASHDIMLTISRLQDTEKEIKYGLRRTKNVQIDIPPINEKVERMEEMLALVEIKMKNLQSLFVSSKQRARLTRIEPLIKKIENIYSKSYSDSNITVCYKHIGKSPVVAKTIDAVIYQVFINLFDNALYWLNSVEGKRNVTITINGFEQEIIFSDNGYGVLPADAPYIFEAFYSGKGEEGRGLGLYIAKRLLNRYKYDIELITNKSDIVDKGANFRISFISSEE